MPNQCFFRILSGSNMLIGINMQVEKNLRSVFRKHFYSGTKGSVMLLVSTLQFILLFLDWPV